MNERHIHSVCVFCGSRAGTDPAYAAAARELGGLLARRNISLVYGGGQVGLMGVLSDAALAAGGRVVGVIPRPLATHELLHPGATQMHVTDGMHARKAKMAELSDAFIALPGGYGTLEELLEVITWAQLGLHAKPVGVLNVAGYFDALVQLVDHAVRQDFIKPKNRDILVVRDRPAELLDLLARHRPPKTPQRIAPEET